MIVQVPTGRGCEWSRKRGMNRGRPVGTEPVPAFLGDRNRRSYDGHPSPAPPPEKCTALELLVDEHILTY